MDKRTKDCYDEVMICHGVDNFNFEREKVKDNETV